MKPNLNPRWTFLATLGLAGCTSVLPGHAPTVTPAVGNPVQAQAPAVGARVSPSSLATHRATLSFRICWPERVARTTQAIPTETEHLTLTIADAHGAELNRKTFDRPDSGALGQSEARFELDPAVGPVTVTAEARSSAGKLLAFGRREALVLFDNTESLLTLDLTVVPADEVHTAVLVLTDGYPTTLYIPLGTHDGQDVVDPAYPTAGTFHTTILRDGGSSTEAVDWSLVDPTGTGVAIAGGVLTLHAGATSQALSVKAALHADATVVDVAHVQLVPTPLRVAGLTFPAAQADTLYVPPEPNTPGTSLGLATSRRLAPTLVWNDAVLVPSPTGRSATVTWSTSTPDLVSVDASGLVQVKPGVAAGSVAKVKATVAGTDGAPDTSATVNIPIDRKSAVDVEF